MPDKPTAVVFDIGRVLFDWDLRFLFEKLIFDPVQLDWFLTHVINEEWHFQSDQGRSVAEIVAEKIAEFPDHRDLIEAYPVRFNETLPHAIPGTHELAHRLAGRGVPLFGLTNFSAEFWAGFRPVQPIFELFADVVVSGEERCAKPNPGIYAIAEQRFGLAPAQLFFTDDNPANVAAANARGWQAHVFTGATSLEAELIASNLL